LEQLWSCVRWTATKRIQLAAGLELVAEAKVGNLDVQVAIEKKVFSLPTITATSC